MKDSFRNLLSRSQLTPPGMTMQSYLCFSIAAQLRRRSSQRLPRMAFRRSFLSFLLALSMIAVLTTGALADRVVLVAGEGEGEDGGPAKKAAMGQPFGIDFDSHGNLYIADFTEHRVRKVDSQGIITTIAGTGKKGFAGDGGPALQAEFNGMHDLVVGPNDDVFVADSYNLRVRKIDAKTGVITTVAGTGVKGVSGDGGPGDKAGLDGIGCLFLDAPRTKLYMTGFSGVVRVLDLCMGTIDTIKGMPGGRSVAVDSKDNVYVGGGSLLRVRRPNGQIEVLIDKNKAAPGELTIGDNTKHIAIDAEENLLIADDFGHAVKRYLVAEKKVMPLIGSGKRGSQGVGGPPLEVELNGPHGVYYHAATKTIYVCDSRNRRVLKVEPEGAGR